MPQQAQPPERDIYEHFTDPDDVGWELTERVPSAPSELPQTVAYVPSSVSGEVSNGHDPDGYDPADFEPPLLEAVTLHDFEIKPVSADSTTKLRMTIVAKTYRYNDKGVQAKPAANKAGAKK